MPSTAQAVLTAAATWRGQTFSQARYGASPFCASFVRWCFKQVNGSKLGLPEARSVPYYVRNGIHVSPGPWFADSLAGEEIGPVVTHQQPGDLLFFHDTARGPWPVGSITHVGIAVDSGERMADAGSGGLVHFRSHLATFPGKLVEIRRPLALGNATAQSVRRTAIVIAGGKAFAIARGHHVRDLTMQIACLPGSASSAVSGGRASVTGPGGQGSGSGRGGSGPSGGGGFGGGNGQHVPRPAPRIVAPVGSQFHWEISVNDHVIKPVNTIHVDAAFSGQRFKIFGHHHGARAYLNGKELRAAIRVELHNGAAHVWLDGKEIKPEHAEIEIST